MIAEGPKHPDLTAFYCEQVVSGGIDALRQLIKRGVEQGEFRDTRLHEYPQLLVAPVLFSIVWSSLFQRHIPIDIDALLETHIDLILRALKSGGNKGAAS